MDKVCLFSTCLSAGMAWTMTLMPSHEVNSGYFRSSILVILGLVVLSLLAIWPDSSLMSRAWLIAAILFSYFGSIAWQLQRSGAGKVFLAFLSLALLGSLADQTLRASASGSGLLAFGNAIATAGLLGVSMSAMLLGHYYLTAPWMTLQPLYRLLIGIVLATGVRLALAIVEPQGIFGMASGADVGRVDWWFYLALRWVMGIGGPAILTVMAWKTLKLRHTQAATGILYVVVIMAFIGEATGVAFWRIGGPV